MREIFFKQNTKKLIAFDVFSDKFPDTKFKNEKIQRDHWIKTAGGSSIAISQLDKIFKKKKIKNYELVKGDVLKTIPNYVKKNYGDFDTTNNPLAYNGFEVFEKTNFFVVYQRESGEDGIMNEEIYISTPALDEKLGKFYADKEMEMIQNSQ